MPAASVAKTDHRPTLGKFVCQAYAASSYQTAYAHNHQHTLVRHPKTDCCRTTISWRWRDIPIQRVIANSQGRRDDALHTLVDPIPCLAIIEEDIGGLIGD